MKLNNFVIISFLIINIFAADTATAAAEQGTTSASSAATTECAEGQLKIKGACVDLGTCKADLKFFKAVKRNNTGAGPDQLPNLPNFAVTLENKNLKLSVTFQNSTGLKTNLEGGSCLNVYLSRFKVAFTQQQDDPTTITSVLNADNSRTWSFLIDSSNFDTYLAKDQQTNYTAYSGFYAVNLNFTNTVNVQLASFAFRFVANLTTDLSSILNFDVRPRPRGQPVCADTAETQCVQQAASTIVCCGTDSTCKTTVTNTTLVVGETYYFLQNVTENGFNNGKWRPNDANITVQANGVTKMVKPKIFSQSASGTIYEVKFKFIANNVTIASDATLAQVATRRLLETTTDTNASAVASTSSSCITTSANVCPTSDQVTTYNSANCAGTSCDDDASSNAFIIIGITIMSLLI